AASTATVTTAGQAGQTAGRQVMAAGNGGARSSCARVPPAAALDRATTGSGTVGSPGEPTPEGAMLGRVTSGAGRMVRVLSAVRARQRPGPIMTATSA